MKQEFLIAVLVCFCVPTTVHGQVHKCKNSDGTVNYSDQPCPGASGPATASRSTPTSEQPPSKKDIDMLKDFNRKVEAYMAQQSRACKAGDMKACEESACAAIGRGRGPAEDFMTCAKARGLPYGNYWAISSGKPQFNTAPEWQYLNKLPDGMQLTNNFTMTCFRKKISSSEVEGFTVRVKETMQIAKGKTEPALNFTFSVDGKGWDRNAVSPAYRTLEDLADRQCEK